MGVHGLLTYLQRNPRARERRIGLRHLAYTIKEKTHGKTAKLLCDFLGVLYWLLSEFHEAKIKRKDYQRFSYIYGGNMIEYEQRFLDFVRAMRHLGIEPIFFVDGARGSDRKGFEAKLKTHRARHLGKMGRVVHCNQVAKYDPREEVDTYEMWFPHPMVPLQILMALKSEGVVLEHCVGEADAYLASRAQSGEEDICGILTGDTDMVMMRGCEVFLCPLFDTEKMLGIRSVDFNSHPSEVLCDKVLPSKLAEVLEIPETDLRNLSIICGNDYTHGLNKMCELHEKMNLSYPIIENAAQWLKETQHEELEDLPLFEEMDASSGGQYSKAIAHTYKAYEGGLTLNEPRADEFSSSSEDDDHRISFCDSYDSDTEDHPLYQFVLKGVREGRMTRELLSMVANNPVHWRTGVVEILDPVPSTVSPCIDDLLLTIRHIIYRLLGLERVTEYGRCGGRPYYETSIKVGRTAAHLIYNLERKTNLERVCLLTTFLVKACELKDASLREFELPIRQAHVDCTFTATFLKALVVSTTLLFSYDLRRSSQSFSLDHVPDVFLVTCFLCVMGKSPRKVYCRPSPEAAEIASGYACIIEHSYHLASLLGLFEMMPCPAEMYQSAALIPFYAVSTSIPSQIKHQLRANPEMAETHSAYNYITKLASFRSLKALIEEVYQSSKSSLEPLTPHTLMNLVIAFLEVLADIDEADKQNHLFVHEIASHSHQKPKHKSKLPFVYFAYTVM